MSPPSAATPPLLPDTAETERRLRKRSLLNLLRMGHCAPAIMQTLLEASGSDARWLVKLTAGLPGGIGDTGGECGGVTAPLVLLGRQYGLEAQGQKPPLIVFKGHDLLRRFAARHGTASCREIRGRRRVPWRCIGVVRQAPVLCAKAAGGSGSEALSEERQAAYGLLHAHWAATRFHCAQSVFWNLGGGIWTTRELLDATAGFLGGTVCTGLTCSALTAGIMALGLARGEVENSRLRVLRMIATMALGGDAFADGLNAFNKTMNRGHRLAEWFAAEHGSTQCLAITECDFSTTAGVQRYIDSGAATRCGGIARNVALKVQGLI